MYYKSIYHYIFPGNFYTCLKDTKNHLVYCDVDSIGTKGRNSNNPLFKIFISKN